MVTLDPDFKRAWDDFRDSINELDLADDERVQIDRALMDRDPTMMHAFAGIIRKARVQGPAWQPPGRR